MNRLLIKRGLVAYLVAALTVVTSLANAWLAERWLAMVIWMEAGVGPHFSGFLGVLAITPIVYLAVYIWKDDYPWLPHPPKTNSP